MFVMHKQKCKKIKMPLLKENIFVREDFGLAIKINQAIKI